MTEREYPTNTWEQIGPKGVAISPIYTGTRTQTFYGWGVWQRGVALGKADNTNPDGKKEFAGWGLERKRALADAMAWAHKQFGITHWKRNLQRDYIDADANYKPLQSEVDAKARRKAQRDKVTK